MKNDPFKEYNRQIEPDKHAKKYAWHTAIALQAVDGIKTSEYLKNMAVQNIEGEITIDEVKNYGIYDHAGSIRDYNITKKEWVLNGATVIYGSASELQATLAYCFSQEQNFSRIYPSLHFPI